MANEDDYENENDAAYEDEDWGNEDIQDELGYSAYDWSQLPEGEELRHDEIIVATADDLKQMDQSSWTDLHKWAAAQVLYDHEDPAGYARICNELVMGPANHPALDYGEIALELINDLFIEERYADARALLPTVERLNPTDDTVRPRFEASLCIMEGQVDEGLRRFQEMLDANEDDAAFTLTIGMDLIACARFADALEVLEKAHESALRDYADEVELLDEIARAREYAREMLQARN